LQYSNNCIVAFVIVFALIDIVYNIINTVLIHVYKIDEYKHFNISMNETNAKI